MGCASSKTAEDKDDISKSHRKSANQQNINNNNNQSGSSSNINQNGKPGGGGGGGGTAAGLSSSSTGSSVSKSKSNANNLSGTVGTQPQQNSVGQAANNTAAQLRQNSLTNNNSNNYVNPNQNSAGNNINSNTNNNNNNTNSNTMNNSFIESNNLILLTEFFKAVGNGELDKLKQILNSLDELNMNRSKQSQIRMTKQELLNAGMADADGLTALSIAAGRKHKVLTEYLSDLPEVDVNKASESGITPLLMVAEVGWTDVMKKLLKRGANVDAAPKGRTAEEAKIAGSTPLIGATKYNNPEAVKLLLEHGANPNHQNQSGISALMLASEQGFFECVQNLCDGGADVELAPSGKTALSMNLSGQTPLFCAAKEGHLEIVKYLLDRGANPNATNHYGVSVLWIPCQRGLIKIVELLLQRGADPEIAPSGPEAEERSISGWTPLYAAIKSRQYPVVKLLLNSGANPNAVTSLGSTPFLLASEIGDLEVIKCFVEHGANLDYSPSGKEADDLNITGQTALFMATLKEQNDVVQYLIEKGSKVNVKNRYGVSPLLLCAEGGNETLVKLLVSVGADVNMSPSGELAVEHILAGQTPLYGAAKKGHYHICKYLLDNGAMVNAETMVSPIY